MISTQSFGYLQVTAKLCLIELVAWGTLFYLFTGVLPAMQSETGWGHATLGLGLSSAFLISGFLSPLVGRRIDDSGPRETMFYSVLIASTGLFVWSYSASVVLYLTAWVLIGIGMSGILYPAAFAAMVRFDVQRSRQGILAITLVAALASTLFIPTSNLLASSIGWRATVRLYAVFLAGVLIPITLSLPRLKSRKQVRHEDINDCPSQAMTEASQTAAAGFAPLAIALMLADAVSVAFNSYLLGMLLELGQTEARAAGIAGLAGLSKVGGRLLISGCRRFSALSLLRITLATKATALALPLIIPDVLCLALMVVLFGITDGARTLLRPAIVVDMFDPATFGRNNGKLQTFTGLAEATAPFLFGGLIATLGWHRSWSTLSLCTGGALFVLFCVHRGHSRSVAPTDQKPDEVESAELRPAENPAT